VSGNVDRLLRQPLIADVPASATRNARLLLLLVWLAVIAWLAVRHVPWRDEARAFLLALMGEDVAGMLRAAQGEGHPFLWYLILRAGYALTGAREVLPAAGLMIGATAVGLLLLKAPFRLPFLALLVFSKHLGFEYTVISRNYGLTALLLFVIAASWARVRDSLWLGVLLLLLANTNVPSVILAGALFFYRLLELCAEERNLRTASWKRLAINGVLLGLGVLLCFVAVYPPANEAAAVTSANPITIANILWAPFDNTRSFVQLIPPAALRGQSFLFLGLLFFLRSPRALAALISAFVLLKCFFFLVYPGYYRHSALFLILVICLAWIEAERKRDRTSEQPIQLLAMAGGWSLLVLFACQTLLFFAGPVKGALQGRPTSHAADLARILDRPEVRGGFLMIDPDTMGESVAYQTGRPFWLIRQDRPGLVAPLLLTGNRSVTLDGLLAQADQVHRRTGQPVVIALFLPLEREGKYDVMFRDYTILTPEAVARFRAITRPLASLRSSTLGENYDVYLYPR
jgi:hypothetical protein